MCVFDKTYFVVGGIIDGRLHDKKVWEPLILCHKISNQNEIRIFPLII